MAEPNWCEKHFDMVAKQAGWEVLKRGWPDRVIVKEGQVLFVEVKTKGHAISEDQLRMFALMQLLGFPVRIAVNGEMSNLLTVEEYQQLPLGHRKQADGSYESGSLVAKAKVLRMEKGA